MAPSTGLLEERLVHLYRQGKIVGGLFRPWARRPRPSEPPFALERGPPDAADPEPRLSPDARIPPFDLFAQ